MPLEVEATSRLSSDPAAQALLDQLQKEQSELGLIEAVAYYGFPRFRDEDDELLAARVVLVSPRHGVLVFGTVNPAEDRSWVDQLAEAEKHTDAFFGQLYGKLISTKSLRAGPRELRITADALLFAPLAPSGLDRDGLLPLLTTSAEVRGEIETRAAKVDRRIFDELIATVDGSRVLPRPKKRETGTLPSTSKGAIAARLEAELATFDRKQRQSNVADVIGPQRIRGLAGSGKTIILSKKAALAHLDDPDAKIAYTFYTKSLYQQVRRLITRFYRDEHDRDPLWDSLHVLHAWGGSDPGIYSTACRAHGVSPIPFAEANRASFGDPFNYVCSRLLQTTTILPQYDYLFIDEGQDYPPSFLQLCEKLVRERKFVLAYDELQTIFQPTAPTQADIFGVDKTGAPNVEFTKDIVLYKCYRNPLEILVCAHAVGFGIYGRPVQMLENADHWADVGYVVEEGDFTAGSRIAIRRPAENSLPTVSQSQSINEIVVARAFSEYREEIAFVAEGITSDIADGLRPDDIVVAVLDDRNAKQYLSDIATALAERDIKTNNIHGAFGLVDFQQEGHVTLTTIHKAKGNEAYMVYVVGVDAVFQVPNKRNRNKLFTAMTRAKAWVRVSGVGADAEACVAEIKEAKSNCPHLRFTFPSAKDLETMKRDLGKEAILDQKIQRTLDLLSDDELAAYLEQRRKTSKTTAAPARGRPHPDPRARRKALKDDK